MNVFATAIATASTTAILAGSAHAQSTPVDDMIATLRLPVGQTTHYFNAATQAVVTESCNIRDTNSVVCDVRVLGAAAMTDFSQTGMVYTIGEDGEITIDPGEFGQDEWSYEFDAGEYKDLMTKGSQASWTASSPLAETASDGTVIQNDVRGTELRGDRAYAWSSIPITENRGISLTQSFEDQASARLQATVTVSHNGATVSADTGTASRDFVDGDYDSYVVKYYNESQKGYGVASP